MIKVLVADDHPVVRDGLRALFAEYPSIDLIGRLSLKTVSNNTSSILNKLNVGTLTEAAILARDRGLGSTSK
jgi:DNA-binding NarL/FixJ family response regulator